MSGGLAIVSVRFLRRHYDIKAAQRNLQRLRLSNLSPPHKKPSCRTHVPLTLEARRSPNGHTQTSAP